MNKNCPANKPKSLNGPANKEKSLNCLANKEISFKCHTNKEESCICPANVLSVGCQGLPHTVHIHHYHIMIF